MDMNESLVRFLNGFCFGTVLAIVIYSGIDIVKRLIALKNAKIAHFFVKTAFAFERGDCYVGQLTYYNESAIRKEIAQNGVNLGDYVAHYLPRLNFPIDELKNDDIQRLGMAKRVVVKKDDVNKYQMLIIAGTNGLVTLNCMGIDHKTSQWFGAAVYTNNPDLMRLILFKVTRTRKHDPTCYVVRP